MRRRRGIGQAVACSGEGVHSAAACNVWLLPASPGSGIAFKTQNGLIPARLANVQNTEQRTVLSAGPARMETVEHLLAACYAMGIDDLTVEVEGPELPIFDGSSLVWASALAQAGLAESGNVCSVLQVRHRVEVRDGDRWAMLEPADGLFLDISIDFPRPIGLGRLQLQISPDSFLAEIAPARTFGFAGDLERLHGVGLGLGANLVNTVAFDERGVMNPEGLRFPDEPLRHKALDVLGDLALLGAPLHARVTCERPGHGLTLSLLARALASDALF